VSGSSTESELLMGNTNLVNGCTRVALLIETDVREPQQLASEWRLPMARVLHLQDHTVGACVCVRACVRVRVCVLC
jgi:hypothetical protein